MWNFRNGKEDGRLMLNQRYRCSAPGVQDVFKWIFHKKLTFGKVVTEHADSGKIFYFWLVLTAGTVGASGEVLRAETAPDRSSWLSFPFAAWKMLQKCIWKDIP